MFYRLKVDTHRSMSPHSSITEHTAAVAVSSKRKLERVQYVQDLELDQVVISKTHNPKSKIRSFNISSGPDPNNRVLIQLDMGGRIPSKFGVDVSDNGKTYLRLTVPDWTNWQPSARLLPAYQTRWLQERVCFGLS